MALREELEMKFQVWRKQVFRLHCQSLENAENRAKELLRSKSLRIAEKNRTRTRIHAKSLERISLEKDEQNQEQLRKLKKRMTLIDQWKAKRNAEHKEIMKKARKAAELRQIITCGEIICL